MFKRALTLVLCLALTLSLVVVGSASAAEPKTVYVRAATTGDTTYTLQSQALNVWLNELTGNSGYTNIYGINGDQGYYNYAYTQPYTFNDGQTYTIQKRSGIINATWNTVATIKVEVYDYILTVKTLCVYQVFNCSSLKVQSPEILNGNERGIVLHWEM